MSHPIPISLDVVALFTSVPVPEAITAMADFLKQIDFRYLTFSVTDIERLFSITSNCYFRYDEDIYKQIRGLPMANSLSSILAIIFLHRLESQVFYMNASTICFSRYVDDVFCLTRSEPDAKLIRDTFNSADLNIDFELELPSYNAETGERKLSLLDFEVTTNELNGSTSYSFYKKAAKKDLFKHRQSAQPNRVKINA